MLIFGVAAATAQNHWTPVTSQWDNYQTLTAYVVIDGVEQRSVDIEVACFVDGVCRGSQRLIPSVYEAHTYLLYLQVWGSTSDNGKPIMLQVYDHAAAMEYTAEQTPAYEYNGITGYPAPYVVSVETAAPSITTTTLPEIIVGTQFSFSLSATGTPPFTWSIASGALPDGLTLSPNGVISGTPNAIGAYTFTIRVSNPVGDRSWTLTITVVATASNAQVASDKAPEIRAYPNPVVNDLFIKANADVLKVEIYSFAGLMLKRYETVADTLSLSDISSGIYLLKVYTRKGVSFCRIIKSNG